MVDRYFRLDLFIGLMWAVSCVASFPKVYKLFHGVRSRTWKSSHEQLPSDLVAYKLSSLEKINERSTKCCGIHQGRDVSTITIHNTYDTPQHHVYGWCGTSAWKSCSGCSIRTISSPHPSAVLDAVQRDMQILLIASKLRHSAVAFKLHSLYTICGFMKETSRKTPGPGYDDCSWVRPFFLIA